MSIQSLETMTAQVETARQAYEDQLAALKQELVAATRNGVPVAAAARAAGVSRSTAINWIAKTDGTDE